jgi:predicted secreted protein
VAPVELVGLARIEAQRHESRRRVNGPLPDNGWRERADLRVTELLILNHG